MFKKFLERLALQFLRGLLVTGMGVTPAVGAKLGQLLRKALPNFSEDQVALLLRYAAEELDPRGVV